MALTMKNSKDTQRFVLKQAVVLIEIAKLDKSISFKYDTIYQSVSQSQALECKIPSAHAALKGLSPLKSLGAEEQCAGTKLVWPRCINFFLNVMAFAGGGEGIVHAEIRMETHKSHSLSKPCTCIQAT